MPEVAKCPLCGKKPYPYHYEDHIEYVHCCVKCEDEGTWNRYAAAMELAFATVANEGVSSFDEDYETNIAFVDAKDRVLEVFK